MWGPEIGFRCLPGCSPPFLSLHVCVVCTGMYICSHVIIYVGVDPKFVIGTATLLGTWVQGIQTLVTFATGTLAMDPFTPPPLFFRQDPSLKLGIYIWLVWFACFQTQDPDPQHLVTHCFCPTQVCTWMLGVCLMPDLHACVVGAFLIELEGTLGSPSMANMTGRSCPSPQFPLPC